MTTVKEVIDKLPPIEDFVKKVQSMNISQLIDMQKDLDELNQILVELNNKSINDNS
jgi:hypothetical protein